MVLNKGLIRTYSRLGQRAVFGLSALELAKQEDKLMVLTADVSTSAGLDRFRKTCPDQYLDVGIAEQNMLGVAAGLASEGYKVITATFAPFQTMRCCEQIRVNLGYMQEKVVMVGLAGGIVLGTLGNTHCCVEDIGVLRSIPNLAIVSPADCGETAKALFAAVQYPQSVYIRLTGGTPNPPVYGDEYSFGIGKAVTLREGENIAIISNGSVTQNALKAADILLERGIRATVVNMHTVKPLDTQALEVLLTNHFLFVTVEEHNVMGGLGSAVAEYLVQTKSLPGQLLLGISDRYEKIGPYHNMLEKYGLLPQQIADSILLRIKEIG